MTHFAPDAEFYALIDTFTRHVTLTLVETKLLRRYSVVVTSVCPLSLFVCSFHVVVSIASVRNEHCSLHALSRHSDIRLGVVMW